MVETRFYIIWYNAKTRDGLRINGHVSMSWEGWLNPDDFAADMEEKYGQTDVFITNFIELGQKAFEGWSGQKVDGE